MRALMPWSRMPTLQHELDRMFERFLAPMLPDVPALGEWTPALDVAEGKEAVTVTAELPGVDPKDIAVTLEGDLLTLKGAKEERHEEKDERWHRVERSAGTFIRTVRLPAAVDAGAVTATFKNGVVTVTLPKTAGTKGTLIPVKAE
ncbi:MAG TPA: Hsp20/alpha crystallin family protein [Methylomirabilota bacterium]|nr:Hsp20/alpha crystallin family protein [Methylomirabilota bacterium]